MKVKSIQFLMPLNKLIIILAIAVIPLSTIGQIDTIHIHIRGIFKEKEVYRLAFESQTVTIFGKANTPLDTIIIINKEKIEDYSILDLYLYKGNRFTKAFVIIKEYFVYDPVNDHIHIYHIRDTNKKGKFITFSLPHNKRLFPY